MIYICFLSHESCLGCIPPCLPNLVCVWGYSEIAFCMLSMWPKPMLALSSLHTSSLSVPFALLKQRWLDWCMKSQTESHWDHVSIKRALIHQSITCLVSPIFIWWSGGTADCVSTCNWHLISNHMQPYSFSSVLIQWRFSESPNSCFDVLITLHIGETFKATLAKDFFWSTHVWL